jgi:hypothetical protein
LARRIVALWKKCGTSKSSLPDITGIMQYQITSGATLFIFTTMPNLFSFSREVTRKRGIVQSVGTPSSQIISHFNFFGESKHLKFDQILYNKIIAFMISTKYL